MRIFLLGLMMLWCGVAEAVNYCADANNAGCFLMEDSGTETDRSTTASGGDLSVSASDTIPQSADKKFGDYSRDFEAGDTEYLTHADGLATDISGANAKFSIVAWVKFENDDNVLFYTIAGKYDITGNQRQFYYAWDANANKITGAISSNGTAGSVFIGGTQLSTGTWYHVAVVYNDVDVRVYLNGNLDSNGASNPLTFSAGVYNGSAVFMIGQRVSTPALFDGLIDDVGIFSRDLSSTEINDIMTNGLSPTSIASLPSVLSDSVWSDVTFN